MYFQVFNHLPLSKYVFIFLVFLIFSTQLIGWTIWSKYELFNYNGCSYSLKGLMTCSGNQVSQCIGPSIYDCDEADLIIYLFTSALIYPIPMLFYIIVHTIVFYICNRTWFSLLKHQQFLWAACYCICSALFFITTRNLRILSQRVQVNLLVTAASISLGIQYVLIVLSIIFIKFELNAYLDENQHPIIQAAMVGQRVITINSQPQQLANITLLQQFRQQQLLLMNLQIQQGSQQRFQQQGQIINQLGSAHQYYQPEVMNQTVPYVQQQHSGQSVPLLLSMSILIGLFEYLYNLMKRIYEPRLQYILPASSNYLSPNIQYNFYLLINKSLSYSLLFMKSLVDQKEISEYFLNMGET